MKTLLPFLILILIFILKKIFFKFQFLLSNTGDKHQNFANKSSVPLVGGLLIFFSFIFILIDNLTFFFSFFLLLIFLLGTLSDLKLTSSARTRLILQLIITLIYIYLSDLRLSNTGIHFLDRANNFYYFNYFFVCFCLLILINGSNFIDGLNGLCLGYYLLIILFLFKNDFNNIILTDKSDLIILFLCTGSSFPVGESITTGASECDLLFKAAMNAKAIIALCPELGPISHAGFSLWPNNLICILYFSSRSNPV